MSYQETIKLINNRVTLFNDKEIAKTYKKYFCDIARKRIISRKSFH